MRVDRGDAIDVCVVLAPSRILKNLLGDTLGKSMRVHSAEDDAELDRVTEASQNAESAAAS